MGVWEYGNVKRSTANGHRKLIWYQFIPCTIFAHGKNKFRKDNPPPQIFW
jgi:hypothetical protein